MIFYINNNKIKLIMIFKNSKAYLKKELKCLNIKLKIQ